ncbi:unnamed protein product [Allacma fusca]|uniref:Ubiquitin-like protease family profile domain-containing protein n=1 Tax=Allacma fusca TaxID=39272 RepID=A0A8J2P9V4_9HEXA|nr:unnamed protein product [Allacma fusca]
MANQTLPMVLPVPKSLIIVTEIREEPDCIDITYDDLTAPANCRNEGLRQKLWLPRKEFRKTSEGRMARSAKRKAKQVAAWATKMEDFELCGQSSIDIESNDCTVTFGVVGAFKNLELMNEDLSTALHSSWLNNFLIDFYAALLIGKSKPYGLVYFPSGIVRFDEGGFNKSELIMNKAFINVSTSTETIVTISNFGEHWIVIVADKRSFKLKIIDTLRGNYLSKQRVVQGLQIYGDLMTQAFKMGNFSNTKWSVTYFDAVVNQVTQFIYNTLNIYQR